MAMFSGISAPPMRGYLVRAVPLEDEGQVVVLTRRIPIVGVVIRQHGPLAVGAPPPYHHVPHSEPARRHVGAVCAEPESLPVIHEPSWAGDPTGGLKIFDPQSPTAPPELAFSVVWCWWSDHDDDARLEEVHEFVRRQGESALKHRERRPVPTEG